jgi:DNA-binding protein HU-beta
VLDFSSMARRFKGEKTQMNKGDLVTKIADDTELTQKQVDEVINSLLEEIKKQVAKGEKITLTGFGTFSKRSRKGRTGRNPRTGEEIKIPASSVPAFSAGKQFKDFVKSK